MRALLATFAALLLLAGCPGQKPAQGHYEIASLAIESEEHVFSGEYEIYIDVESSPPPSAGPATIAISDNGKRFAEIRLEGENSSGMMGFAIPWVATSAGVHVISAAIEGENGSISLPSKSLSVEVLPIGNFGEKTAAGNVPVDSAIWCAQEFQVESRVVLSEAQLRLVSLIPTREGLSLTLEIHNSTPFGSSSLVEASKIPGGEVSSKSEWHSFSLEGRPYSAGKYWLVLKRGDDTGNLAWEFSQNGKGAACTTQSGSWASRPGMFLFSIR
ncbi:MAG: hypothetical protein QXH30_01225 [Candidatus Bilamarchaeaceae archaeon]